MNTKETKHKLMWKGIEALAWMTVFLWAVYHDQTFTMIMSLNLIHCCVYHDMAEIKDKAQRDYDNLLRALK